MIRYVIKRLLLMIPIVLGVSFLIFSIMAIVPGNPATIILGHDATREAIDELNRQLGLDRPFLERYFRYMYNVFVHQDFGISYYFRSPVFPHIISRIPVSLTVTLTAFAFALAIGTPIGILSAVKQYSMYDTIPTLVALLFAAVPTFWLGMMLLLIFSLHLRWFPSAGIGSWEHYILPMLALGFPYGAQQLRFTRSSMLDTIRQDYVRTARAKGAPERTVILKHALKNALLPVVTVIGMNFGRVLGGAVVTETLFSIPGLGTLIVNGIKQKDTPMVCGGVITLAIITAFLMLAVDLVYAALDPRIRARYTNTGG